MHNLQQIAPGESGNLPRVTQNRITRRQALARMAVQAGGAPLVRLAPRDQLPRQLPASDANHASIPCFERAVDHVSG